MFKRELKTPGLYQVRGFDLAVISFIRGKTGWIIIDPLTVKETSRAALQFVNEKLGARPVVAVIISHSHADPFGGIRDLASAPQLPHPTPCARQQGFLLCM